MAEKTKGKKVSIRYIGKRVFNEGKLACAFIDHTGKTVYWLKLKGYLRIGQAYFAVADGDNLTLQRVPDEDETAVQPSEDDLEQWQVADALAKNFERRKKLSAKMERHPALDRAVNSIRPLIKGLDFTQRRALIEVLMTKASRTKDGFIE